MGRPFRLLLPALLLALAACSYSPDAFWVDDAEFPLWRGERAGLRACLICNRNVTNVHVGITGTDFAKAHFITKVTGDVLGKDYNQCGKRVRKEWDSIRVADRIGNEACISVRARDTQYIWLQLRVPEDCPAGKYAGKLVVKGHGMRTVRLPFSFMVADRTLPPPSAWKFHLDLWQNPFSVARFHGLAPWTEEHFEKMRPVMKLLAEAGQKVVTATIIDRPWNGQTEDPFESMVVKYRHPDGSWTYDYAVFDRWVEFMEGIGIRFQINCYSMIPWKLTFDYVDAESGERHFLKAAPGSLEYRGYWIPFLRDFAAHLKERGWFGKTRIAMDERPLDAMKACLSVIREAVPDFAVALAGNYHPELQDELADLCITSSEYFPEDVLETRHRKGAVSTFYTCCAEKYPNTFLASDPMEATWLGWYALAGCYDGYLRWAYNSWTEDPVKDARFRTWPAGDCYIVYPDGCSSVRFERLVEGIQDYEKARVLMEEWKVALEAFSIPRLETESAAAAIRRARGLLE